MFRKRIVLPLILILALTLTACTTDDGMDPNTSPDEDVVVEDETLVDEPDLEEEASDDPVVEEPVLDAGQADDYSALTIKPEEAFDIYMEEYPATTVKEVQLDRDMGQYVYKIEGYDAEKEYEIKIDPISGDILKRDEDMDILDDDDLEEVTREDTEKVAALVDEALLAAGADAVLDEWSLELDDGRTELEVDIERSGLDNIEYTYNVETGQLIEIDD